MLSCLRGSARRKLLFLLTFPLAAQAPPGAGSGAPITLDQAIALALANNPSLRAKRYDVDQSKANEVTAALKPNPVFALTYEDFPIFNPSQFTLENLRTNQELNHGISYLIERGGKRGKRIAAARDNTEIASHNLADGERQLGFQAAQAFIAVLLAKSNLDLARQDLKDFSEVVEINRKRLQAGDISQAEFLKIAVQKLQFEQDVLAAQLAVTQSKINLRQLLAYDGVPENYEVSGVLQHSQRVILLPELRKQALENRADLQAAHTGVRLADDNAELARSNRAPDLTAGSEFKRNGIVNGWGFGLSMEIPIHSRNQGEIARTQYAARQARELDNAARIAVLTDVDNAYESFRNSDRNVGLYESGYLDQARESRDISRYAYNRGAASLLDLLDSERSYRATELAYRQALAAYMISLEQINSAVGARVIP